MELGFTVLSFVLFAAILFFAYRNAKSEFTNALKARDRRLARDLKAMRDNFATMDTTLTQTNANVSQLAMTSGKPGAAAGTVTPFSRMEDRYELQNPNVAVNDVPVTARK